MSNQFPNKTIIGLTGQSGAGKSTVARIFRQNSFLIIDADEIAREITSKQEAAKMLSEHFGASILSEDDCLNRRALAKIVFSDKNELNKLNSLLFPIICQEISHLIQSSKKRYIVLDAPQLFESGSNKMCDVIVSVIAPHDVLVSRIMSRDGISQEDAEKRLASQLSEDFFKDNSDYIIKSDSTLDDLRQSVLNIIDKIVGNRDVFEF